MLRFYALQDVSISINKGEFVLIVGPSGSGKSTLLNMIGLLDKPTSGKIYVDGVETTIFNESKTSEFRNKKVGFIFQFSNLLSDLTVLENVMLPRQIGGKTKGTKEEAMKLFKNCRNGKNLYTRGQTKYPADRRKEQQSQEVLFNSPSIVLADEPTGNLDSVTADTTVQLMKSMCKKIGLTFIIVTHDRHQFGDVDKTITVKDGRTTEGEDDKEPPVMEVTIK